ncbi:MAG: hypothetical protein U9R32_10075, partial [Bacteroidota bacterium]|nr:hypothetical protein [Bacteroidota bacterium]
FSQNLFTFSLSSFKGPSISNSEEIFFLSKISQICAFFLSHCQYNILNRYIYKAQDEIIYNLLIT